MTKYDTQNVDTDFWNYACELCGTPYMSKPEYCCECGEATVVPSVHLIDDSR